MIHQGKNEVVTTALDMYFVVLIKYFRFKIISPEGTSFNEKLLPFGKRGKRHWTEEKMFQEGKGTSLMFQKASKKSTELEFSYI